MKDTVFLHRGYLFTIDTVRWYYRIIWHLYTW